jgi:propanol-preferring alcohol dehydrogenase
MPETMKAFRLIEWERPPELVEVPVPDPGPGEVVLKVGGAGACHSDLHIMEWPEGQMPWKTPFTLGHENAGWVAKVGAGVEGFAEGDAVIAYGPWGCGQCRACRLSEENYCERQDEIGSLGGGLGLDGGMAEYMLVPSPRLLVPLGDLDPRDAAPLTDAALTPYHAIKRSLHLLVPGSTAVVIGVGGLGHLAVQILKALSGARIVAVDLAADKRELAREAGADEAFEPGDEAIEAVRELTGGRGAELVLDMVGAGQTIALAQQVARVKGDLTLVGLGGGSLEYGWFTMPYECEVASTYWGSGIELMEVLDLARSGAIRVEQERASLDDAAETYERLSRGEIRGRAVVCPNG